MVRAEPGSDSLENRVSVMQSLVVPEAKHTIALTLEIGRSLSVGSPLQRVMTAFKLDDQLGFRAAEVRDEGTDGMLATELQPAQLPIAQLKPQLSLCRSL